LESLPRVTADGQPASTSRKAITSWQSTVTPLDATVNIFSLLENTVDKQVSLTVSREGSTGASRTVTVIPTGSEVGLRQWDWVARNQEYCGA